MPLPGQKASQVTLNTKSEPFREITRILLCVAWVFLCVCAAAARAENAPADSVGAIEGDAISVEGPMSVTVVHGQVKTILRSGSDIHVKNGQARIELVEGGQIVICGPAHFSVLKAGGALTLALDSGTIRAEIASDLALTVYTPQVQVQAISIGNGVEDLMVGLDSSGAMCIHANKGAVRLEQQLTGQSVIVPQSGNVTLVNGQLDGLTSSTGHCACVWRPVLNPLTAMTDVSQLATPEDLRKKMAAAKSPAAPTSAQQPEQPEEPIYQVFMPPLQYDAKAKVQAEYDPNLVILVRRVCVRPTLIYQGRVEGDPVMAEGSAPPPKPQAAPPKPPEESAWSRVRTYLRKLWSPAT